MTKYTTIKHGYRITVVSWENDADNYNTLSKDGFSKDEASFIVDILKSVNSQSSIANLYEPSDKEINLVTTTLLKICIEHQEKFDVLSFLNLNTFDLTLEDDKNDFESYMQDFLNDFIGCSEFYYTRVCGSFKVEFIPEDILIEDVTDFFVL